MFASAYQKEDLRWWTSEKRDYRWSESLHGTREEIVFEKYYARSKDREA